jgi:hypothetical protein
MTVGIKDLTLGDQYLADLTDAESSAMNGGYASAITARTGNPDLAARVFRIVVNQSAFNPSVIEQQIALRVPEDLIGIGFGFAITQGRGVYTPEVSFAKLGG